MSIGMYIQKLIQIRIRMKYVYLMQNRYVFDYGYKKEKIRKSRTRLDWYGFYLTRSESEAKPNLNRFYITQI